MSRLGSFYAKKENMHSGSTLLVDNSAQYRPLFNGMVAFPSLQLLFITGLPRTSVIWGEDCFNNDTLPSFSKLYYLNVSDCCKLEIVIPQAMLHRLNNLEYIKVDSCSSLRSMFPPSVASDLTHLKELEVTRCGVMREIIEAGEPVIMREITEEGEQVITDGILFPELTILKLVDLRSLTSFWSYQSEAANTCQVPLTLPQLSSVSLKRLPELRRLFHGANFEFLVPALKEVKVFYCGLLEDVFEDLRGDQTSDVKAKICYLSDSSRGSSFSSQD